MSVMDLNPKNDSALLKFSYNSLQLFHLGLALLLAFISEQSNAQSEHSFHVMTYNIRYDNPDDPMTWSERKDIIASQILFNKVDILGIQEGLDHQLLDLDLLLSDYKRIGLGRDDADSKGEYCAIYYKYERYKMINQGTYWLSLNPSEVGSIGWDAALPRIATFAILRELSTNRELCVFNTHLDHIGEKSRINSANLISALLEKEAGRRPRIVMGDFNEGKPLGVWQWFSTPLSRMRDPSDLIQKYGPDYTYNAFRCEAIKNAVMIDHIFISDGITPLRYGVISECWNGIPPSDHFPVIGEFIWDR